MPRPWWFFFRARLSFSWVFRARPRGAPTWALGVRALTATGPHDDARALCVCVRVRVRVISLDCVHTTRI